MRSIFSLFVILAGLTLSWSGFAQTRLCSTVFKEHPQITHTIRVGGEPKIFDSFLLDAKVSDQGVLDQIENRVLSAFNQSVGLYTLRSGDPQTLHVIQIYAVKRDVSDMMESGDWKAYWIIGAVKSIPVTFAEVKDGHAIVQLAGQANFTMIDSNPLTSTIHKPLLGWRDLKTFGTTKRPSSMSHIRTLFHLLP